MTSRKEGVTLPPIGGSGADGRTLWNRAKNAAASIQFLQKSGKETWRNILSSDVDGWHLPPHVCFCTTIKNVSRAKRDGSGSDGEMWVKRRVMLASSRLLAVSGKSRQQQRVLADLRDVREVVLESSSVQGLVDGAKEVLFPWTITFDSNLTLRVASQVPRDRLLWTSAVQKLSGCPLRGDDGDFFNPSEARRLGTDFDSTDKGLAANVGSLASHAAQVYIDDSHFAGGFSSHGWHGVGRLKMSTGDIYEGSFEGGMRHGKGLMRYATGDIYNGQFVMGQRCGEGVYYELRGLGAARRPLEMGHYDRHTSRRMEKAEGLSDTHLQLAWHFPKALKGMEPRRNKMDRYHGEWRDDVKHGQGVLTEHADAEPIKYHVEYVMGKLILKNCMAWSEFLPRELKYEEEEVILSAGNTMEPNTCVVYGKGPFLFTIQPTLPASLALDAESGTISGTATRILAQTDFIISCHNDTSRKEGGHPATATINISVLENEVASGWRTKHYFDGSMYTGNFEHGVWHGQGTMLLSSGQSYRGMWHDGLRHGHGDQILGKKACYSGEFVRDARCGYGTMHYDNGDKYVGNWHDDCRHGMGELTYLDGHRILTEWRHDLVVRKV